MKKVKIMVSILIFIAVIIGISSVSSAAITISADTTDEVEPGETVTLTVKLQDNTEIGFISGTITTTNIEKIEMTSLNDWELECNEGTGQFSLCKADGATEEDVLEIKITISSDAEEKAVVQLTNLKETSIDYTTTTDVNDIEEIIYIKEEIKTNTLDDVAITMKTEKEIEASKLRSTSTSTSAEPGETVNVFTTISSSEEIGVITGKIECSDEIESINVTGVNDWTLVYNSSNGYFNLYKESGATVEQIMQIEVTLSSSAEGTATVTLSDLYVTTINYETKSIDNVEKIIYIEKETSTSSNDITLSMTASKTTLYGSGSSTITVKITADEEIGVISGTISKNANIKSMTVSEQNGWTLTCNKSTGAFALYKEEGATSEIVMQMSVVTGASTGVATVTLSDLQATTVDYETTSLNDVSAIIHILNSGGSTGNTNTTNTNTNNTNSNNNANNNNTTNNATNNTIYGNIVNNTTDDDTNNTDNKTGNDVDNNPTNNSVDDNNTNTPTNNTTDDDSNNTDNKTGNDVDNNPTNNSVDDDNTNTPNNATNDDNTNNTDNNATAGSTTNKNSSTTSSDDTNGSSSASSSSNDNTTESTTDSRNIKLNFTIYRRIWIYKIYYNYADSNKWWIIL